VQSGVYAGPRLFFLVRKTQRDRDRDRWTTEAPFCRLKDFRRFSRYDKLAVNFLSTVVLARVVGMNKFRS
jgi:transposase